MKVILPLGVMGRDTAGPFVDILKKNLLIVQNVPRSFGTLLLSPPL